MHNDKSDLASINELLLIRNFEKNLFTIKIVILLRSILTKRKFIAEDLSISAYLLNHVLFKRYNLLV